MTIVRLSLAPASLTVDPGGQAVCTVTVKNTGTIVERFSLVVLGATSAWAEVDPPAISLLPDAERTVTVTFRPARGPIPNAGTAAFAVMVTPSKQSDETAVEEGDITVTPFVELVPALRPRASRGATVGHHVLRVTNRGNDAVDVALSASDPDELLRSRVRPEKARVRPGATVAARIDVKPRQVKFVGQLQPLPFQARVQATGAQPVLVDGRFNQRPVLPKWLPRAAVALALAGVGVAIYAQQAAKVKNVAKPASAVVTTTIPKPTAPAGSTGPATTAGKAGSGGSTTTAKGGTATTKATGSGATGVGAAGGVAAGTVEPGVNAQDLSCFPYDANNIKIVPVQPSASATSTTTAPASTAAAATSTSTTTPGPFYQLVTNNSNVKFQFTTANDANAALFVLSKYQQVCYIGAGNGLLATQMMVLEPSQPPVPSLPPNLSTQEKCQAYNSAALEARPPDAGHANPWLDDSSTDQTAPLDVQDLDNTKDAAIGLKVAQAHKNRCSIGGGSTWSSLDDPPSPTIPGADPNAPWVLEYWR